MNGKPKKKRVSRYEVGAAMTFEEIARVLGVSRGLVWHIYSEAMKKLRKGDYAYYRKERKP